ncbi:hypothetical protein [Dactylosporangium salmoneum]|uniref:Uncharacterized protein n=1 Tax=Dactylosporangium salmoneum TaxID=53361 RepID=A0ABN3FHL9_9ACTN
MKAIRLDVAWASASQSRVTERLCGRLAVVDPATVFDLAADGCRVLTTRAELQDPATRSPPHWPVWQRGPGRLGTASR